MHRDLPRPSLRATPKALRYGRGFLLCITWISSRQRPRRGRDWMRKGGRNWKRFDSLAPLPIQLGRACHSGLNGYRTWPARRSDGHRYLCNDSSHSRRVADCPSALAPSFRRMRSRSGGRLPGPGATSGSAPTFSLALAIFLELYLSRLEERLVNLCGDWDLDRIPPGASRYPDPEARLGGCGR